jgi:two-component system phosphate regulon sensor histidine kinase PhoR
LSAIDTLNDYKLRLTVIFQNGRVFYDSENNVNVMDNHLDRPEVIAAKDLGVGSAIRYSQTLNKTLVYVAKQSKTNQIYRLAIPIKYIESELGVLSKTLIGYTLIIFIFCLLVTYFMTRWISAPLKWTAKTLRRINEHKFEKVRPKSSIVKEINTVNNRLVEVSDSISKYIQKVSREKEKRDIILNNMINGLVVFDDDLNIVMLNNASIELCFEQATDSKKVELLDYPVIYDYATSLLSGNEVDPIEIELKDGKQVLIIGSMYVETQQPRGILVMQDITRLKRLESTRQKFVANVSHELKTPITLIRTMFETILTSKVKGIEVGDEMLKKALQHTDRLNDIIDDLLHLSRLETQGGEIEKQEVALKSLCDIVEQQCAAKAKSKQIELKIQIESDLFINCNSNLMVQAMKNLVENAIKYSPESTTVTIWHNATDTHDTINVQDQGPGISQKHIPKLFQRFYRVDNARSRQMGGTGLGLAIVKHISQVHQGKASVISQLDEGSCFSIELPKKL